MIGVETVEARAVWSFVAMTVWGIHKNVIKR